MTLSRDIARLSGEIDRHAYRLARMRRPAVVTEYDAEKHKARARLTTPDGEGGITPWAHIDEAAGAQTSRTTLKVGQTVWVNCPSGDLRQCTLSAGTFSDEYKSSSQAEDETRFERGGVHVAISPGSAVMAHGDTKVTIADGNVSVHTTGSASFT